MLDEHGVKGLIRNATASEIEILWLPRMMAGQTEEEVLFGATIEQNKIGFNKSDSIIATSMYEQIKRGTHLSEKQADVMRKILPKYWRQFAVGVRK